MKKNALSIIAQKVMPIFLNLNTSHQYQFNFRVLGTTTSFTGHDEMRMIRSHETSTETKIRTDKKRELVKSGRQKKHNSVGNVSNYVLDYEDCLARVSFFQYQYAFLSNIKYMLSVSKTFIFWPAKIISWLFAKTNSRKTF